MWNWSLKFYLQQFVPLFISSAINLYDIDFKTTVNKISTILSCIIIPVCVAGVGVIFYVVNKKIKEEKFMERYGELLEELKFQTDRFMIINWRPMQLVRWIATITILVTLRLYPAF
jgi:hypothetical protein